MKKIIAILVVCLTLLGIMTWSFRRKQVALEAVYSRNIVSEYTNRNSKQLAFAPGFVSLAGKQIFVTNSERNEVYVYDLGLNFKKIIRFPALLRGLANFSVQGDTAYAVDGTQTLAAVNTNDSTYRVQNLKPLRFSRFIALANGSYLLKGPMPQSDGYSQEVFKVTKNNTGEFMMTHNVIKNLNDHGLNSDGFFIRGKDGTIFCVSYLNSNVYAFSKEGRYLSTLHTIGNADRNYEVKLLGSSYTFGEPVTTLNIAAGADSLLYLYSRVKSTWPKKDPNEGYVDTYSLQSNYVGSLRVHKITKYSIRCFAVTGDSLIAVEGNQLVTYSRVNNSHRSLSKR